MYSLQTERDFTNGRFKRDPQCSRWNSHSTLATCVWVHRVAMATKVTSCVSVAWTLKPVWGGKERERERGLGDARKVQGGSRCSHTGCWRGEHGVPPDRRPATCAEEASQGFSSLHKVSSATDERWHVKLWKPGWNCVRPSFTAAAFFSLCSLGRCGASNSRLC